MFRSFEGGVVVLLVLFILMIGIVLGYVVLVRLFCLGIFGDIFGWLVGLIWGVFKILVRGRLFFLIIDWDGWLVMF